MRFRSNARQITLRLGFNGLLGGAGDDATSVLVNGAPQDFSNAGFPSAFSKVLNFPTNDFRTIEILFPYLGSLDFLGVSQDPAWDCRPCLPRPVKKLLSIGDSITQGATASKTRSGYVYGVAAALNIKAVNMGVISARTTQFADTSWAAATDADVVTILLGYNDFTDQVAQSTFKSRYSAILNGLIAASAAKIVVVTPLWTSASLTTPISTYRTWITEVAASISNSRISLVDGLSLITNSSTFFSDGVHPTDAGFALMVDTLKPHVASALN